MVIRIPLMKKGCHSKKAYNTFIPHCFNDSDYEVSQQFFQRNLQGRKQDQTSTCYKGKQLSLQVHNPNSSSSFWNKYSYIIISNL